MPKHETPMAYTNWEESVTFNDHGPSPSTLLERVWLFCSDVMGQAARSSCW